MSGREIIADPLNKKKKIELRQGGIHRQIVSRGCDPLQRGTFLRRAGEWPILGTSPLPLPPRTTRRWEGGSAVAQSLEVMGNLRFPLTVLIMDAAENCFEADGLTHTQSSAEVSQDRGRRERVRPRMRQMDVWSRDHRRPIEQEEKDRVAAGWYTSPDSEPRVRSAPAGDVPPTSRRVAHSRNVPRFRSLRGRREGGREVQRWLNAWRLWEISVFPLTVLIMDVPVFSFPSNRGSTVPSRDLTGVKERLKSVYAKEKRLEKQAGEGLLGG